MSDFLSIVVDLVAAGLPLEAAEREARLRCFGWDVGNGGCGDE